MKGQTEFVFNNMATTLKICPDVDVNEAEFLILF